MQFDEHRGFVCVSQGMATEKSVTLGGEGEAARILGEAGAGISVCPENEDELCGEILRLRGRPESRMQMGNAGSEYVMKHFDRDGANSLPSELNR